ncbi:MAG: peptide chain release factor N(5)-glutamine methyltransferase [Clostridium sp.]
MKKCDVGGQALIEGVMMRGSKGLASAVRTQDGTIEIKVDRVVPITKRKKILNIPFLRGIFVLVDSLIVGMKALNYSAEFFEDTEPSKFEDWLRGKFGDKSNDVIMGIALTFSMILAVGLFFGIPTLIASLFSKFGLSNISLNLIEAVIRVLMLVCYIYGISMLEDIYRTFQYHGAEHKTIFCYENEEELTVENVKKHSRFHPRCGTNFLFLIMFISIIVFSFTGWGSFGERLVMRILLLPVVSGITYEVIKWLGKTDNKLARIISYPGMKLQELTTKEPDEEQIEVAIEALMAAEGIERSIGELLNLGTEKLSKVQIDTARLDATLLLCKAINKDKLHLMINKDEKVNTINRKEYEKLVEERATRKPMGYILGEVEFYGKDFEVKEGVLIPRGDTEILVEEVLKHIKQDDNFKICDLCSGSGAVGITLASQRENINVDLIDLYPIPEEVSKNNIIKNNLSDRVNFIKSDLLSEVINKEEKYDIIVSNPPYIRDEVITTLMEDVKDFEPVTALSGGGDGLIFYRRIVEESKSVLLDKGVLAFEIGHDQGEDVSNLMKDNGFGNVNIVKDLAGLDRVVIGIINP